MEGRKDDSEKVRMDLIPPEAIFALATVLTFGANKYAARNWERGMGWGRVFGALMRHMWAWWGGKSPTSKSFLFGDLDTETTYSHLWHAMCCIAFLIAYEERGIGQDDRMSHEDLRSGADERHSGIQLPSVQRSEPKVAGRRPRGV